MLSRYESLIDSFIPVRYGTTMQQVPFNPRRRANARNRATARAGNDSSFLHTEAAQIIAERLAVTNRQFNNCAILFDHPFSGQIEAVIKTAIPDLTGKISVVKFPQIDNCLLYTSPSPRDRTRSR